MTKQEILDNFNDIDFVYNDSSKHETLSRMLDELLKEQEHKDRMYHALEDDWKRLKELMKEQKETIENREQEIRDKNERLKERAEQVDSLLKEQEAVAPILIREGRNKNYNDYVCPRCDNEVVYEQNYCSECGVQFLWKGR